MEATDPVALARQLVQTGQYRIGVHAVRHMVEDGFDETLLLEAVAGRLVVVEEYPEEERYLLLGHFHFTPEARSPLHLVCDLSQPDSVDFVTAYIPGRPYWVSPTRRGKRWRTG